MSDIKNKPNVEEISKALHDFGYKYYGLRPNPWRGDKYSRIYFGKEYLTVENDGAIHNKRYGRARALTIGSKALEDVIAITELYFNPKFSDYEI